MVGVRPVHPPGVPSMFLQTAQSHPFSTRKPKRSAPRRRRPDLDVLEDRLCLSSLPTSATLAHPDAATQARLSASYGQFPLSFEANRGQTDSRVNFLSRGAGYSLF